MSDDRMDSVAGETVASYSNAEKRIERINHSEEIDAKFGFARHRITVERVGWLVNFQSVRL